MKPDENLTIHSGFPNPATDVNIVPLDLTKLLIKHPPSTFFMRIDGHGWENLGIFNNDLVIVDKSLNPKDSDLVIFWDETDFCINKFNKLSGLSSVWGVVTSTIHRYR